MKISDKNSVVAYNWAFAVIDNLGLTAPQQLVLLHIVDRLNRNYWKPVKIADNRLAIMSAIDKRTAIKAIDVLANYGVITVADGFFDIVLNSSVGSAVAESVGSSVAESVDSSAAESPAYMSW